MNLDDVLAERYVLDFEDRFDRGALDRSRWVPYYLPQWSSAAESAARYEFADGHLHLLIEADQQPWCPELDGPTRVSSLQTGVYAGPVGSSIGQHRFHPGALVREALQNVRLYTPSVRGVRTAGQGHQPPEMHGLTVDDRLRGPSRAIRGDLHLRDLREER